MIQLTENGIAGDEGQCSCSNFFFFFAEVASDCPLAPEEIATISIFMYTMEGIQKKQVNLPVKKSYLEKKKSLTKLLALTFMSFAPYVDKI